MCSAAVSYSDNVLIDRFTTVHIFLDYTLCGGVAQRRAGGTLADGEGGATLAESNNMLIDRLTTFYSCSIRYSAAMSHGRREELLLTVIT